MKLQLTMTGDGPVRWLWPDIPCDKRWAGLPDLLRAADGTEEHPHYAVVSAERTFVRLGTLSPELQDMIGKELAVRREAREFALQAEALKHIPKPDRKLPEAPR